MARRRAHRRRRRKFRPVKRPGALKRKLKRGLARRIAAATRSPVYTRTGKLNTSTLRKFRNTKAYENLDTRTKQEINFAIVSRKWRRR